MMIINYLTENAMFMNSYSAYLGIIIIIITLPNSYDIARSG
ncbi:hypothetical protein NARC_130067 [Candidatus Nitrosocosmicus arcticus]|uniref:Uncharacterized protein n=1 Tax=Candidatus Nitrosocosmicus arcticus TaxID=2035267 RepID=A0A557ST19_9ARCH|nr:hypothetical protein NARC_130067 [Candidatus Nitrosocosmicus arcticus]